MIHEDYLREICGKCGCTYGAHQGGTSPWPRDYCPGHEGRMDWEEGPGMVFKPTGRYKDGTGEQEGNVRAAQDQAIRKVREEREAREAKWELRKTQEKRAWSMMTWWQLKITQQRLQRLQGSSAVLATYLASVFR